MRRFSLFYVLACAPLICAPLALAAPVATAPAATILRAGQGNSPQFLQLALDGKTLVFADAKSSYALDLSNGKESAAFKALPTQSGAISPDGAQILAPRYDFWLIFQNARTGETIEERGPLSVGYPSQTAYSPDGKLVAVAHSDAVTLLDAATRQKFGSSPFNVGVAYSVAFSPSGDRIAAGFGNRKIEIFSTTDPVAPDPMRAYQGPSLKNLATLSGGGAGYANHLGWARDGKTLFAADQGGALTRWDLETRAPAWSLEVAGSPVTDLEVSPSGQSVAICAADLLGQATLMLVDSEKGKPKLVWDGTNEGKRVVAKLATFAPDGKTLYVADTGGTLWRVPVSALSYFVTPPPPARIDKGASWSLGVDVQNVKAVAFSPDGNWVVAATSGAQLLVFEVANGARRTLQSGHAQQISTLAFAPDGKTLASGGRDGLELTDFTSGQTLWHQSGKWAGVGGFSPDGQTLYATFGGDLKAYDRAGKDLKTIASFGKGRSAQKSALAPDGKKFAVTYYAGPGKSGSVLAGLDVFDVESGQTLISKPILGYPATLAWSSDSQRIAVDDGDYADGTNDRSEFVPGKVGVSVWDVATGAATKTSDLALNSPVSALAFSPDGAFLARSSERLSGESKLIALKGKATEMSVPTRAGALAFSPDGKLLAAGFSSGPLRIFRVAKQ